MSFNRICPPPDCVKRLNVSSVFESMHFQRISKPIWKGQRTCSPPRQLDNPRRQTNANRVQNDWVLLRKPRGDLHNVIYRICSSFAIGFVFNSTPRCVWKWEAQYLNRWQHLEDNLVAKAIMFLRTFLCHFLCQCIDCVCIRFVCCSMLWLDGRSWIV